MIKIDEITEWEEVFSLSIKGQSIQPIWRHVPSPDVAAAAVGISLRLLIDFYIKIGIVEEEKREDFEAKFAEDIANVMTEKLLPMP